MTLISHFFLRSVALIFTEQCAAVNLKGNGTHAALAGIIMNSVHFRAAQFHSVGLAMATGAAADPYKLVCLEGTN